MPVLIEVKGLKKYFPIKEPFWKKKKSMLHAVDGISFNIMKGKTTALVGESGCGKTTTARLMLRLMEPNEGVILYEGRNIFDLDKNSMKNLRRHVQIIFQNPFSSLNPRKTVSEILALPFSIHKTVENSEIEAQVLKLLEVVGLNPPEFYADKLPHEFSGGERQRIGVARAISLNPSFIVADEPVSALDVNIQAQVLNLMKRLQEELNLTYLYITHDLSVVRSMSDDVVVMYLGKIVEIAKTEQLYNMPLHPYTQALLSAFLIPNPRKRKSREKSLIKGEPASPIDPPAYCRFYKRCPFAKTKCGEIEPTLTKVDRNHFVACHLNT